MLMPVKRLLNHLLGFSLLLPLVEGRIEAVSWTKIVLPKGFWYPLNSTDEKAYGHRMACAVGCQLMGEICKAFLFDETRSECFLGDIVPTWADNNYIPEYIRDGKEVSMRRSLLKKKALTGVSHIGFMDEVGDDKINDIVPEKPELMPVDFPIPISRPYFGVVTYKNTIVVCGGKLSNGQGDKKCRQWSFKTKRWNILGETYKFHFHGAMAILNDRLYMFSGLNTASDTGNANVHVESYDFISGTFQEHADVSSTQDLYYVGAVALPNILKILLVNGREGNSFRARSFLYDPAADTYTLIATSGVLSGTSDTNCAVHPGDSNVVVCAGGWTGSPWNSVYLYDVTAGTFQELTDVGDQLPFPAVVALLNVNSQLYAVTHNWLLLKYSEDGNPRWTELPGAAPRYNHLMNFVYDIDYHEILV